MSDQEQQFTLISGNRMKKYRIWKDTIFCIIHYTVNHSENFVDPITRVHTQNIGNLWKCAEIIKIKESTVLQDKC